MNKEATLTNSRPAENPAASPDSLDTLLSQVYDELHGLAEAVLSRHRTIDPTRTTSLINDVYVRLARRGLRFRDRSHFLVLAAKALRFVLIDRARRCFALKRGGGAREATLNDEIAPAADAPDLLELDEALNRLAEQDKLKAELVELRFFGGLSVEEAATAIGLSEAGVKREWMLARAWLYRMLHDGRVADS